MKIKPIVSVTYENERISINKKKQPTLLKMYVTSVLCGPRADLWPFYGFLISFFVFYRSYLFHPFLISFLLLFF